MLVRRVRSLVGSAAVALVLVACAGSPQAPASSQDSSELDSCPFPPGTASCWDQCAATSGQFCVECCGGTANECAAATATCFDSCARGVGPWLPC
jgi:hypothetical protein